MDTSAEHVRKEIPEKIPVRLLDEKKQLLFDSTADQYADAELESRTRRIEQSIEKARRAT